MQVYEADCDYLGARLLVQVLIQLPHERSQLQQCQHINSEEFPAHKIMFSDLQVWSSGFRCHGLLLLSMLLSLVALQRLWVSVAN